MASLGTSRGKDGAPLERPVTPPHPTLSTDPVPYRRERTTYSVGPAAAVNASLNFRILEELEVRHVLPTHSKGANHFTQSLVRNDS